MKLDIRVYVKVRGGFYYKVNFVVGRKKFLLCNFKSFVNKLFNI